MGFMEKSLLEQVMRWLETQRGSWREIADETGLGYQWLTALMQGDIQDPGVRKIERLARLMRERQAA